MIFNFTSFHLNEDEVKISFYFISYSQSNKQCEGVGFGGRFGKQQVIDEGTTTRSMRSASTARVCIDLNR